MVEEKGNCSAKGKCRLFIGTEHVKHKKKVPFCEVGYTQNPKTEEATKNAIMAGAEVCNLNQHRRGVIESMHGRREITFTIKKPYRVSPVSFPLVVFVYRPGGDLPLIHIKEVNLAIPAVGTFLIVS